MTPPLRPANEDSRLSALREYGMLDTPPDPALNDLAALAAQICKTPVSLISLVDEQRLWFKSKVGWPVDQTPREGSFCAHTIQQSDLFIVPDATKDKRYTDNALAAGRPDIRFYAGAPLVTTDGHTLGTLCVMDRAPRRLNASQKDALRVLARQVIAQFDLRRHARELEESEQRLLNVFRNCPVALAINHWTNRKFVDVNDAFTTLTGFSHDEVAGRTAVEANIVAPDAAAQLRTNLNGAGRLRDVEMAIRTRDGGMRHVLLGTERVTLRGEPHVLTTFVDITVRKRAQLEAEHARANLERAQLISHTGSWEYRVSDRHIKWSDELYRIFGLEPGSGPITYDRLIAMIHPDDRERHNAYNARLITARPGDRFEVFDYRVLRPDAREACVLVDVEIHFDPEGNCERCFGTVQDITERKLAEEKLRSSEGRYRTLVEQAADAIFIAGPDGRFREANTRACEMFGYTHQDFVGLPASRLVAAHEAGPQADAFRRILAGERVMAERQFRRQDGTVFPGELLAGRTETGLVLGIVRDVTERKLAEAVLRRNEERFQLLIENASDLITVINHQGIVHYQSPSIERVLGYKPEQLLERNVFDLVHPEDAALAAAAIQQAISNPATPRAVEYRIRHESGRWCVVQSLGRNIPYQTEDGFIVVNSRDVTELRQLEEQFRQSQKLEAIGQLAGGVAHDFNNLLSVIQGYSTLLLLDDTQSTETAEAITEIVQASERAADLTRQLLAFSRRQVMQLRRLDLNETVTSLGRMLQRIVGEDVRVQVHLHPTPVSLHADAGMLDQVLLNLVVNARDAMPNGGRLQLETGHQVLTASDCASIPDSSPGRYASLRVTDTGSGIKPDDLARIFEPFFTTKAEGKGTGLGLSTVFGIIKQHQGCISVVSEAGKGTTFQILFPLRETVLERPDEAAATAKPLGGRETLLLVEDDAPVRRLSRIVLERHGYHVLEAAQGTGAMKIWEQHRDDIQLLFTDLVMPEGLGGRELAARLRAEKPDLRVVFTSGYSEDIAGKELALQPGQLFVQKPATPQQILAAVRKCLDD